jgi:hypothetical protein
MRKKKTAARPQAKRRTRRAENKQIRELRKQVETVLAGPEFKRMSKALRHSLAQRLGATEIPEGGLMLQMPTPMLAEDLKARLRRVRDDDKYSYCNIYCYSFW